MLRVLLAILFDRGPSCLDLVVESDPVYQLVTSVKVHGCMLNLAHLEKLVHADVGRCSVVLE